MAHFAELDENNLVKRVIAVDNSELLVNGVEDETKGKNFCQSLFGENTRWVQTSYNGNFRKKYAGIGDRYDIDFNVFIEPQPFPSWKLNYTSFEWEPPVPKPEPEEGYFWKWSEINKEWIKVPLPQELN